MVQIRDGQELVNLSGSFWQTSAVGRTKISELSFHGDKFSTLLGQGEEISDHWVRSNAQRQLGAFTPLHAWKQRISQDVQNVGHSCLNPIISHVHYYPIPFTGLRVGFHLPVSSYTAVLISVVLDLIPDKNHFDFVSRCEHETALFFFFFFF